MKTFLSNSLIFTLYHISSPFMTHQSNQRRNSDIPHHSINETGHIDSTQNDDSDSTHSEKETFRTKVRALTSIAIEINKEAESSIYEMRQNETMVEKGIRKISKGLDNMRIGYGMMGIWSLFVGFVFMCGFVYFLLF